MVLFVIFGTRGVTMTKETAHFHCPSCNATQQYRHRRVRRFFTLYFIPLIPLDLVGEYVECQGCQNSYKLAVLSYDPAAGQAQFEAEFHGAVKRVMVSMMLADGAVEEREVATIRSVYQRLAGQELARSDVDREIDLARSDGRGVIEALKDLSPGLNDPGKELVVKAALYVAAADGNFDEKEKDLVGEIGAALGMTPAHLKGVIQSAQLGA